MSYLGLETIRRGNSADCIKDIFTIIFPEAKMVADVTYGTGRFWKWDHKLDIVGFDIEPQMEGVIKADYRRIPLSPKSVDVLCLDPPFLWTPGLNRIMGTKRFFTGSEPVTADKRKWSKEEIVKPTSYQDLLAHTWIVMEQAKAVARQGVILKGQNLIDNKPLWWTYDVMKLGEELGYGRPFDMLLQHSTAHRMKDPRWKQQKHFRRAHCYYVCYRLL